MRLFKLTTSDNYTRKGLYNQCLWGEGVTHSGTGEGQMCGPGFIHAYAHPLITAWCWPIHFCEETPWDKPKLWIAEGKLAKNDGLKCACVSLTTLTPSVLPEFTKAQQRQVLLDLIDFIPETLTINPSMFSMITCCAPSTSKDKFSLAEAGKIIAATDMKVSEYNFPVRRALFTEHVMRNMLPFSVAGVPLLAILDNAYRSTP